MQNNTILVIEDDLDFAHETITRLQSHDFNTLHTDNGDQALKLIEEHKPQGIALDIQLKGSLGLNIIKALTSEDCFADYNPTILVVSSFVGPQTISVLQKHKILHYDKTLPAFKHSLVTDFFSIYLGSYKPSTISSQHAIHTPLITNLPTGDPLKKIIYHKLDFYKFNVTSVNYKRLVDGIYYTLNPNIEKEQTDSLVSIYENVLNLDYQTVFMGLKRLLADSFKNNPNLFTEFAHNKEKPTSPTPKEFIYYIASEIKKDFE